VQGLESAEPYPAHLRGDYEADRMCLKPGVEALTEMQNPDLLKKNNPNG